MAGVFPALMAWQWNQKQRLPSAARPGSFLLDKRQKKRNQRKTLSLQDQEPSSDGLSGFSDSPSVARSEHARSRQAAHPWAAPYGSGDISVTHAWRPKPKPKPKPKPQPQQQQQQRRLRRLVKQGALRCFPLPCEAGGEYERLRATGSRSAQRPPATPVGRPVGEGCRCCPGLVGVAGQSGRPRNSWPGGHAALPSAPSRMPSCVCRNRICGSAAWSRRGGRVGFGFPPTCVPP